MEFNYIVNPKSGRKVSIYGKTGQRVLKNYLQAGGAVRSGSRISPQQYCHNGGAMRSGSRIPPEQYCQNGGSMRSGSRIPPEQYCQKGGNKCKKYRKTREPKCEEQDGCKWIIRQGCLEDESDVHLAPEPKKVTKTRDSKAKSSRKNCKSYKKTKEPKCEEQDGCYWVTNKGCLDRMSDSDNEMYYEPVKPRAPMRASAKIKNTGKKVKTTTTKKHGKTQRLSAGTYYRTHGQDATLGDRCNIRQSIPPEYKCMTKTKTNVARWGKCPSDYNSCQEDEYR